MHPSIPDKIRRQLIRDTFADKIQAYCEAKQRAREQLTAAAVDLVDEFEQYMERLHPSSTSACGKPSVISRMMNWEPFRWTAFERG
ncbi:MAG: hypothetical protein ACLRJV_08755 [Eubacteriales bacterium]